MTKMQNIDFKGYQHIVWTCMHCGFINGWNWKDDRLDGECEMHCDACGLVTLMKPLPPEK